MSSLANLTDEQNMLLTQLSYSSHILDGELEGKALGEILGSVPDKKTNEIIQKLCNLGLGDLKIKAVENDYTTGFGAIAFTDSSGNTGFSYRGTDGPPSKESLNDWFDNLTSMLTGTSAQTAQAEAFFDANSDPSGNNYLYGHSKGGQMSESVFVNNSNKIKKIHLLNPQPLNPYSLTPSQLIAMQSDKVDIVIIEGDYVWWLGSLPTYLHIRVVKSNGKNPHMYEAAIFNKDGSIDPSDMSLLSYMGYLAIQLIAMPLQHSNAFFGTIYNSVVRIVDFVRDELLPKAKEFIAYVSSKLKMMGDAFKDFADKVTDFLKSVYNRAKEWYRNTFDKGYKYANANPYIQIETTKMKNYASRLYAVNRRLINLDRQMNSLYTKVGLLDLFRLLQADILTGYSGKLTKCASYLTDTANEFNSVENSLNSKL